MNSVLFAKIPIHEIVEEKSIIHNKNLLELLINKESYKYLKIYDFDNDKVKCKLDVLNDHIQVKPKEIVYSKPMFKIKGIERCK